MRYCNYIIKSNSVSLHSICFDTHRYYLHLELLNITDIEEIPSPKFLETSMRAIDSDLTKNAKKDHDPIGERIIVLGKVIDEFGRAVPECLLEIWQANSAGRYVHREEVHDAPLDPNFLGAGMTLTNKDGNYKFTTINVNL